MIRPSRSRLGTALALGSVAAALVLPAAGPAGAQVPVLPVPVPPVKLEVLSTSTQDPTALSVAPDGRVVWAERTGRIKVLTTAGATIVAGRIPVAANACSDCPDQGLEEGGIHGLELAADFAQTGRFYAYYSVPGSEGKIPGFAPTEGAFRLSSFLLKTDNAVDLASEQVLLTNPAQWDNCCHYGGDIDLLPDGTILLSVGDDTSPRDEGWNPRDKRPGREAFNAERTSQNRLDRRGKVLRLMPDGTVPDGEGEQAHVAANPHVNDPTYDPYVYAMGFRSNYRIAPDPLTGRVFVGNVGPDAYTDDAARGPRGYDEIETIPAGGGTNHGWPLCIANNLPYVDWDYEVAAGDGPLSCAGMTPASVYYPYAASADFPTIGAGPRASMAGVVYRYSGNGSRKLPDAMQGKLVHLEWMRQQASTIAVKADGTLDRLVVPLVGGLHAPIDATIGPDGAIYLAEYGTGVFYNTSAGQISRIVPSAALPIDTAAATAAPASPGMTLPLLPGGSAVLAAVAGLLLLGATLRRRVAA